MPCLDYIKVEFECQGFRSTHMGFSPKNDRTVLFMKSTRKTKDVRCVRCGSEVYLHEEVNSHLMDMPIWHDNANQMHLSHTYFRCKFAVYSRKYLNGKGSTVSCPFLTNVTFINGSNIGSISGASSIRSTFLIFAAH